MMYGAMNRLSTAGDVNPHRKGTYMSVTRKFLTALTISTALAGASFAQDATLDTVVASVGETDITLGHMIAVKQQLPEQYRTLPNDRLFPGILEQLVQQTLLANSCLLYTSPSPRDKRQSRMPSSA